MAGRAVPGHKWAVNARQSHIIGHLIVTLTAKFALRFDQKARSHTFVRQMASQAVGIPGRLMIETLVGGMVGMTVETETISIFLQQSLLPFSRNMWSVAA